MGACCSCFGGKKKKKKLPDTPGVDPQGDLAHEAYDSSYEYDTSCGVPAKNGSLDAVRSPSRTKIKSSNVKDVVPSSKTPPGDRSKFGSNSETGPKVTSTTEWTGAACGETPGSTSEWGDLSGPNRPFGYKKLQDGGGIDSMDGNDSGICVDTPQSILRHSDVTKSTGKATAVRPSVRPTTSSEAAASYGSPSGTKTEPSIPGGADPPRPLDINDININEDKITGPIQDTPRFTEGSLNNVARDLGKQLLCDPSMYPQTPSNPAADVLDFVEPSSPYVPSAKSQPTTTSGSDLCSPHSETVTPGAPFSGMKMNDDSSKNICVPSLPEFRLQALEAHNTFRARHGAPPLQLSDALNGHAQEWAIRAAKEDDLDPSTRSQKTAVLGLGRNVWCLSASGLTPIFGSSPVETWYEENVWYDFNKPTNSGAEHFTQVIWFGTRELGVGMAVSDDERHAFVVCYYKPPGNSARHLYRTNVLPIAST